MVEEVAMVAAEEVCAGMASAMHCIFLMSDFFLTLTATATDGQGHGAVFSHEAHLGRVIVVAVVNAPSSALVSTLLLSLSPSPFLLL
jgi:hypothetical protein